MDRNISDLDYARLMTQLQEDLGKPGISPRSIHRLYLLLRSARRWKSEEIPDNTVTMNSEILIRNLRSGNKRMVRIVYGSTVRQDENPDDPLLDMVVYEPPAMEILGRSMDDVCIAGGDQGNDPILIEKVLFQPEAHRLFNL